MWLNGEKNGNRAVLRGAVLRGADLSGADLSGADLGNDKTIISVSGIGSSRRMTTFYVEIDKIWCVCFTGTLQEFENRVKETYEEGHKHRTEYDAAISFFKAVKNAHT
jgi:hypothetical protein